MADASESIFTVTSALTPAGDQPEAIAEVADRLNSGQSHVVLHGATGTGKSATTAWVIEKMNKPTLVLAPNKVLAAQLAAELRELLPGAFVGFFVSHFAYYRPEAYMPQTDTFIEKDSAVDQEIERLRHEATVGLLTRRDVVIVASVSAIYGLGRPAEYRKRGLLLDPSSGIERDELIRALVAMGYERNDMVLERGRFRVRGDTIDVYPAAIGEVLRCEFFGDDLEEVRRIDPLSATALPLDGLEPWVFPTTHHVVDPDAMTAALDDIRAELDVRVAELERSGSLLEAQRLRQRTEADLESLETTGFCKGIENYSRHFDRRGAGEPPACLVDYFPDDFLLVVDESHVTVPQVAAMFEGDQSRKRTLVEHGFRLPSALDNRPLSGPEFWSKIRQVLALSATPSDWEYEHADGGFVEQVIRPTGLVDPAVHVVPQENRLVDLLRRIREQKKAGNRVLVTTLTKRQAEDLTDFLTREKVRVRYLHSDVDTVERIATLRDLRTGKIDVVVGVNLLREGLDLPEVGLVAVLDADSVGFLRSATALVQTIGRAARNPDGQVILYADEVTAAMQAAISETNRRRDKQLAFNAEHGITPARLSKAIVDVMHSDDVIEEPEKGPVTHGSPDELLASLDEAIETARARMKEAAAAMRFEDAAAWRDEAASLARERDELADARSAVTGEGPSRRSRRTR